jgi:glycosyltransferase involved in cell wall biosynthesis
VSIDRSSLDLSQVALIIPALNEAECLAVLLPLLRSLELGQTIVCDNGSTDATRDVVERNGALWVYESKRGYGAACWAGMQRLATSVQVVAFMDADLSDDPAMLPAMVEPVVSGDCDLVLGARAAHLRDPGSTSFPQRVANRLFPALIRLGWGHTFADLGPFRAIRRSCLDAINMQDRAFGWTIEMQVKAVELGLRIREIFVTYRKRPAGSSKISGSVRGACLAAYWITRTCAGLWFTKRRRMKWREQRVS